MHQILLARKMSTFSVLVPLSLIPLLVLVSSFSAEARFRNHLSSENHAEKVIRPAEKLFKALNLFPRLDANIIDEDPAINGSALVEKQFKFPFISNCITNSSNGTTVEDFGHHAGYYRLAHTKGARMFYYFFESRNKSSSVPVVIWLSGGPGCSGSIALFYENGPFKFKDDLSLVWNEFGWDKESNLIYVDQPTGTGFSYSTSTDDIRSTSEEAAVDLSDFLQAFFEKHPQYAKNDFYITGESYAGHYIPAFADQVQKMNKNKSGIPINLKGLAIGNGLTNPGIQHKAYIDYALEMKLINRTQYDFLTPVTAECEAGIKQCNISSGCPEVHQSCNAVLEGILAIARGINYYDIRKKCEGPSCYNFSSIEKFMDEVQVKEALGVGNIDFVSCSGKVYRAMRKDWVRNYEVDIPELLQDGVKLLIYAGEYDLLCNWIGNSRWTQEMNWYGQKEYSSAQFTPFTVDGIEAGLQKSYGPLTFLKLYNAGHLVPMDQPKNSLEMLRRWLQGTLHEEHQSNHSMILD